MSKPEKSNHQRQRGGHEGGAHGGGHHGGAWKVAYADFTTAMMAFFMLMWILAASSPTQKHAIARYFRSEGVLREGGSAMSGQFEGGPGLMQMPPQNSVLAESKALEQLAEDVGESLDVAGGEGLGDQVNLTLGDEGLVIEITDDPHDELFAVGGDEMNPAFEKALDAVAAHLKTVANPVRLEGYTDARQYPAGVDYSNWELSVDRANAARRRLESHGLARERFESVVGYGDGRLALPEAPLAPANRRITITVLRQTPVAAASETPREESPTGFRPIGDPFVSRRNAQVSTESAARPFSAPRNDGR
ncbi:MAG TPA: flagellar motor protein MotB [Candidatus Krumholzibacteria bacterium]|nr:flagellar motor protein MotB [Candidatus Krumholzibacteria bacterium]HPD70253.1 flagellar motor protein MotB [Candidatus Krumholzibacteria bacterium]HRY40047.1 flagellar motor protein MotB [Candidatus Krumholzibacteria bacterium]